MTASRTTYIPPNALRLWVDPKTIYIGIEGPATEFTIVAYPRTTKGLSQAIDLFGIRADVSGPPILSVNHRKAKMIGTPSQHASAEAMLRQMGVIKS